MTMNEPENTAEPPPRKHQFTIRGILFATTLVAVAAAGFAGLVRANDGQTATPFVLFVVAAPLALMLVLSLIGATEQLVAGWKRRRNNSNGADRLPD